MEEKIIKKAEILSYLVVKVYCDDGKEYIVNLMRTNHQMYDPLKADKASFFKNFRWNKYLIYWSPTVDVSVDDFERFDKLEKDDDIDFYDFRE